MNMDNTFFESLAHYASGMATMSFGIWAAILYKWRKRNRMTFLLFLSIAYIALSFLKDIVFLLPPQHFSDFKYVEDMSSIFDLSIIPLASAFFIETTRPGFVTNKRLLAVYLPFIICLPLYCLLHSDGVLVASFMLSVLVAIATLVVVPINVIRYNKYLADNYSYTQNMGVGWCMGCAFVLFLLIVFYGICFYQPTWFGEMIYDVVFIIIWNIVCTKSRHHHVVVDMIAFDSTKLPTENEEKVSVLSPSDKEQAKESFIAKSLEHCMEKQKLYLNSRLSLLDLAMAVGTNKTYISTYINSQGITFYDFINKYRVEEACRIIDNRTAGERISMADVASQSGFNSISSFNRYFSKIKGITPTAYSHRNIAAD